MFETFELIRGDTFLKEFESEYTFRVGDKLHIAVMNNAYSNSYLYENVLEIAEETNTFQVEILPEKTQEFPIQRLLFEIELTMVDGFVTTNQYWINVKVDGINGKN